MSTGVRPFLPLQESGLLELIGINEQIDTGDYSGSVALPLRVSESEASGELLAFMFVSTEEGSGAVQQPTGTLMIFDADPAPTSGDTALTAAEHQSKVGEVKVVASDWVADAAGGTAYISNQIIPFHACAGLYLVFKLSSTTSLNDAAGDDEVLDINVWYRQES